MFRKRPHNSDEQIIPSAVFVPTAGKLGSAFELTNINLSHLLPHVSLTGIPFVYKLLGDVIIQHNILTWLTLLVFGRSFMLAFLRAHSVSRIALRTTAIKVPTQMPKTIRIIVSFFNTTIFV